MSCAGDPQNKLFVTGHIVTLELERERWCSADQGERRYVIIFFWGGDAVLRVISGQGGR